MERIFKLFLILTALFIITVESQNFLMRNSCKAGTECIPHYKCNEVLNITRKGNLTNDEKSQLSKIWCGKHGKIHYVCCKEEEKKITKLPESPICGTPLRTILLGGESTFVNEFTWVAQIIYSKPGNETDIHCEGSLINDRYVLTAASCVQKVPDSWKISKVRLGDWDLTSNNIILYVNNCQDFTSESFCNNPYLEVPVEKIIVHKEYDHASKNQHNDIALLKLEQQVSYNEWINPICLTSNISADSQFFRLVGFLKPESNANIKLQMDIEGMPKDECQEFYSDQNITISDSQFCGKVSSHKPCHLYNGGALTIIEPSKRFANYAVAGIPSFKPPNCEDINSPAVYTRVSSYVNWIERSID